MHRLPMTSAEVLPSLQDDDMRVESILFKSIRIEEMHFTLPHMSPCSFALPFHSLTINQLKELAKDRNTSFYDDVHRLFLFSIDCASQDKNIDIEMDVSQ